MTDAPRTENDLERWERINNILAEVFGETERQWDLWGQQDHPLVSPEDPTGIYLMGRTYRSFELFAKAKFAHGERSWALIEFEELMEALSQRDPEKAREEWVQVAAVAVQAVGAIDRGAGVSPEGRAVVMDAPSPYTDLELPDGVYTTGVFSEGDPVPPLRPDTDTVDLKPEIIDCYAETEEPGQQRCAQLIDHPPHGQCHGNGPLRREPVTPEKIDANYAKDLDEDAPSENGHTHTFDRLHGLCRCGEGRS